jgi:uncharacterized protein (TIGR02757 family)
MTDCWLIKKSGNLKIWEFKNLPAGVSGLSAGKQADLKSFLDSKYDQYNRPEFIETDPIQVPHHFIRTKDIEIAGYLTATLAWGQRKTIINKSKELLQLMENSPYDFIMNACETDFARFEGFCHRTFNATDTLYFLHALKNIYTWHGGLRQLFEQGFKTGNDAGYAIACFRKVFFTSDYPERTRKHVPDVSKGSSAKRLNMFLRWMVRHDDRGVDFGLWTNIDPAWLQIPLDLHTGNTARKLGLLTRKQNDRKAVCELTNKLQSFDPHDPVKYDFALFGLGAFEKF